MLSINDGDITAVIWDFEQPEQKVSDRFSYTKVIPSHPAPPAQLRFPHLAPNAAYQLEVYRTGLHANDAYTAYLEMGSPKDLTAAQIAHMSELTRDLTETDKAMRSGPTGAIEFTVPMNSNGFVLVRLKSVRGSH